MLTYLVMLSLWSKTFILWYSYSSRFQFLNKFTGEERVACFTYCIPANVCAFFNLVLGFFFMVLNAGLSFVKYGYNQSVQLQRLAKICWHFAHSKWPVRIIQSMKRSTKTLIRMHRCATLSEPWLFPWIKLNVFSYRGPYVREAFPCFIYLLFHHWCCFIAIVCAALQEDVYVLLF